MYSDANWLVGLATPGTFVLLTAIKGLRENNDRMNPSWDAR